MPQFYYNDEGDLMLASKYKHSGAFALSDIFGEDFRTGALLEFKAGYSWEDYGLSHRYFLAKAVFFDFMIEVLWSLTAGGMFVWPGKSGANIALKPYKTEFVEKLLDFGMVEKRDLDKMDWKLPYFEFHYGPRFKRRPKRIKVPDNIREAAETNAKERNIKWLYYSSNVKTNKELEGTKTYEDYLERMQELYPGMTLTSLRKIIKAGLAGLLRFLRTGADFIMKSLYGPLKDEWVKFYTPIPMVAKQHAKAKKDMEVREEHRKRRPETIEKWKKQRRAISKATSKAMRKYWVEYRKKKRKEWRENMTDEERAKEHKKWKLIFRKARKRKIAERKLLEEQQKQQADGGATT